MAFSPTSGSPTSATKRRVGFWVLFGCLVNNGLSNSMLFAVLPPLAREVGISPLAVGATYAVAALFFTVMSQVWGGMSDRFGRRPIIMLGLGGAAASMFAMAGTIALARAGAVGAGLAGAMIIASRALFGFINSAVGPSATAWVADRTTPEQRTSAIATLTAAFGLGAAAGPAVGAAAAPFIGLAGPFVATGVAALAGLLAVRAFLPERTPPKDRGRGAGGVGALAMALDPRLRDILLIGCGIWVVQAVGLQIVGFAAMDRLDLTGPAASGAAGVALTAGALAALTAQAVVIPAFRLRPRPAVVAGGALAAAGALGLAAAADLASLAAAFAVQGFGLGLARPGASAAASLAVEPEEQGRAAGLASASAGVGFFVSAAVGAGLYEVAGSTASFAAAAVIALAALAAAAMSPSVARASRRAMV